MTTACFAQQQLNQQDRYIRYTYDNDYFNATDRYYTQGMRLEWIAPVIQHSPLNKLLIIPENRTILYSGFAVERDGFTPNGIRHVGIYYGERPYAGVMFLSQFSIALDNTKKQRISSSIDIGMMGPVVGGKQEQTTIHRAIGNLEPLGWDYQIANDAVINYGFQFEKGIYTGTYSELIATSQVRAGTLYDDAGAGLMLRTGLMSPYFDYLGLSKYHSSKIFQCYAVAKGGASFVAYNATMQGGMFNQNSVYTLSASAISRWVASGYCGLIVAYKNVSLEYTRVFITPEFKGGLSHGWGHCNIAVAF